MPDVINLSNDDAAGPLRSALGHLQRYEAREVIAGIDESRRLGIEESVSKEEVGRRNVGMVRRRPPTDLEMLHIVFERLHQRLIVLPAIARALQRYLGVHEIVWRVDPEFVSRDRLPALEAGIDDLLPTGVDEIAVAYQKLRDMIPNLVPPTKTETV
jgi:hypothetical protein